MMFVMSGSRIMLQQVKVQISFPSGGFHMSFGLEFVAMLKSGSGKLAKFSFLLYVLAVPCVCGPLALVRFNSSQAIGHSILCSDILYILLGPVYSSGNPQSNFQKSI